MWKYHNVNVVLMLGRRRIRRANIRTTSGQSLCLLGYDWHIVHGRSLLILHGLPMLRKLLNSLSTRFVV